MTLDQSNDRPRLFVGNFDFEAALVSPSACASRDAIRRNSELAIAWLGVARPGDVIVAEHLPDAAFESTLRRLNRAGVRFARPAERFDDELELTPWGWERRVIGWADACGLVENPPPLHAIVLANSREFSFACERDLGCGLEGQAICCSVEEVNGAVSSLPRWLIKANLGASGRERITGSGPLTAEMRPWLERRLDRDGMVFVEPLVDAVAEAGVQWEVPHEGEPELVGVVPLLSDDRGQYRGSVISGDDGAVPAVWQRCVEVSRIAAKRVQALGYFGPLGIDAMRYRDASGVIRERPLQDINARWTMGRIALGWRDHVSQSRPLLFRAGVEPPHSANELRRISPDSLGGETVRHQFWLDSSIEETALSR